MSMSSMPILQWGCLLEWRLTIFGGIIKKKTLHLLVEAPNKQYEISNISKTKDHV